MLLALAGCRTVFGSASVFFGYRLDVQSIAGQGHGLRMSRHPVHGIKVSSNFHFRDPVQSNEMADMVDMFRFKPRIGPT